MAQHRQLTPLTGPVRTLPRRIFPSHGEAWASWAERTAYVFGVPLARIVSMMGLIIEQGQEVLPGWGIAVSEHRLLDVCTAAKLAPEVVKAMLLTAYDGTFADLSDIDPDDPATMFRAAVREWVRFNGSRFCPLCLAEQPRTWQLRWKLNWSFACVQHQVLLRDDCEECGRGAGKGRSDATVTPAYLAKVFTPGCCRNARQPGHGARGAKVGPCGAELWIQDASVLPVAGRALEAQREIDLRIDQAHRLSQSSGSPSHHSQAEIRQFAQDTRSLAALIQLSADLERFCLETNEIKIAVEAFVAERTRQAMERLERGRDSRTRVFTRADVGAPLIAAALTPAVEIALLRDRGAVVEALAPIARAIRANTQIMHRQLTEDFQLSPRLADAFSEATAATGSFGRVSHRFAIVSASRTGPSLGPQHVPQLMPDTLYAEEFVHMLPRVLSMTGRRFCAMAAVKSFGLTWPEAAGRLGLPLTAARYSTKAIPLINGQGLERAFYGAIAKWLESLGDQSVLIDYALLRRRLEAFDDIEPQAWMEICRRAGISHGQAGRRSRYAAAWTWAEVTRGDWRLSPAMKHMGPSAREIYGRVVRHDLAPAFSALRELGRQLASGAEVPLSGCSPRSATPGLGTDDASICGSTQ